MMMIVVKYNVIDVQDVTMLDNTSNIPQTNVSSSDATTVTSHGRISMEKSMWVFTTTLMSYIIVM